MTNDARVSGRRLAFLSRERIIAPPGFNRWKVPPASVAIHLCIGSVYAWIGRRAAKLAWRVALTGARLGREAARMVQARLEER